MSIWTYLAIALITMEADAIACYASGVRYRLIPSAVFSSLWPVTTPCVIAWIIKTQNTLISGALPEQQGTTKQETDHGIGKEHR